MGTGYTRQSEAEISDGETIFADPIEAEFDAIQAAFHGTTGHAHDGTAGEGPKILLTNGSSVTGVLSKSNGGTGISTYTIPTATGTANVIVVTANEPFTSYTNGQEVWYKAISNNTGPATVNANSLGARKQYKSVPDQGLIELEEGDILTDQFYQVIYDPTLDSGTGGWHLINPSGVLKRHCPLARVSSIIKMGDTGDEATQKFRSLLGVDRATIYYNNLDGKLYIKSFNSSGVAVGNPLVFDGNEFVLGNFSTAKAQAEAVLNHIVAFDDNTSLFSGSGTTSWVTWPLTEAFDPRGIVSVASNQFTVNEDCYIDWTAGAAISLTTASQAGVKTRLYDVTDGNAVFWSTILGDATTLSSGTMSLRQLQGMMKGHGVLEADHTYRIEAGYKTNTSGASVEFISSIFRSGTSHWEDYPSLVVNIRTINAV